MTIAEGLGSGGEPRDFASLFDRVADQPRGVEVEELDADRIEDAAVEAEGRESDVDDILARPAIGGASAERDVAIAEPARVERHRDEAPPSSISQIKMILRNQEYSAYVKLVLIRQQLPMLKTELRGLAQHHSEAIATMGMVLANLCTEHNVWKMQYATDIIARTTKKLGNYAEPVGSLDDYPYHLLLQLSHIALVSIPATEGSLATSLQAYPSVLTIGMTLLSTPSMMQKAVSAPWYVTLKSYCGRIINSFINYITPKALNTAKRASTMAVCAMLVSMSAGSEYSSKTSQILRVAVQSALNSEFGRDGYVQDIRTVIRVSTELFSGSAVGAAVEMLDFDMPTMNKVARLKLNIIRMADFSFDNATQVVDSVMAVGRDIAASGEDIQRARAGEDVNKERIEHILRTGVSAYGADPIQAVLGDKLAKACLAGREVKQAFNARNPMLSWAVQFGGRSYLNKQIAPLGILFGTSMNTSLIELSIRLAGSITAVLTNWNLTAKAVTEVAVLLIGPSESHFKTQLKKYPGMHFISDLQSEYTQHCMKLDAKMLTHFDSPGEWKKAKVHLRHFAYTPLVASVFANSAPITFALLGPHAMQSLDNGLEYWGVVRTNRPIDPISILPYQLGTAILFTLLNLVGDENPFAVKCALNAAHMLMLHPYILDEVAKSSFGKATADKFRTLTPGLNTHEMGTQLLNDFKLLTSRLGIPVPGWVSAMANATANGATIHAAYIESAAPNLRILARNVGHYMVRSLKTGGTYNAVASTAGHFPALMVAARQDTRGSLVRQITSVASMYILTEYCGIHEMMLGGWILGFINTGVTELAYTYIPRAISAASSFARRTVTNVTEKAREAKEALSTQPVRVYSGMATGVLAMRVITEGLSPLETNVLLTSTTVFVVSNLDQIAQTAQQGAQLAQRGARTLARQTTKQKMNQACVVTVAAIAAKALITQGGGVQDKVEVAVTAGTTLIAMNPEFVQTAKEKVKETVVTLAVDTMLVYDEYVAPEVEVVSEIATSIKDTVCDVASYAWSWLPSFR